MTVVRVSQGNGMPAEHDGTHMHGAAPAAYASAFPPGGLRTANAMQFLNLDGFRAAPDSSRGF